MKKNKFLSLLMAVVMLFSVCVTGVPAFAENTIVLTSELCEHHPTHTAECGYEEAIEGSPCTHVHDVNCGYAEPSEEVPCDKGCTDTDGDSVIDHVEGCAYQPASAGSPCNHVHDSSCSYVEEIAGSPCTYVCEICNAANSGTEETSCTCTTKCAEGTVNTECPVCSADFTKCEFGVSNGIENAVKLSSFDTLEATVAEQKVALGTTLEQLNLPTELKATDTDGQQVTVIGVTWEATPAYDANTAAIYTFVAVLPEGYTLSDGVELPKITVTVGDVVSPLAGTLPEVYLNGTYGDDKYNGETYATAVQTFERAKELLAVDGTIYVCGRIEVSGTQTWSLEGYGNAKLQRYSLLGILINLQKDADLTLEHITIDGNADKLAGNSISGDELIRADYQSTLTLGDGCVLQNNQANAMGAAIAGWEKLNLIMEQGAVIQNNHTTGAHYGGAIFLANDCTFTMNGGEIKNNLANRGGAISLIGSSMTMNGGSISGNSTNNTSDGYGGAIYISDYEGISGLSGTPNAITPHEASFIMKGGTISGNSAYKYGGAILTYPQGDREPGYQKQKNTIELYGGTISGNKIDGSGGGIAMFYNESHLNMSAGTIAQNTASDFGGGIFLYEVTDAVISGGAISGNIAANGAGVNLYTNSQLQLSGGEIYSNRASVNGGGIYIGNKCTLNMTDGSITGNDAKQGGGLYLTAPSGTSKVIAKITGGVISANIASEHLDYKDENNQWQDYTKTFSNGVYLGAKSTLQLGGTAMIDMDDDIAIYVASWSGSTFESYIQVIDPDWNNHYDNVSVTSQSTKVPKYVVEQPESSAAGTKLVSYNYENGSVEATHSQAAADADADGLFVPSVAMLEVNPALEIGQSQIAGRTNILTYVEAPVTIAPADVTIYVGGTGYTGVVNNAGQSTGTNNGFPVPGFTITGIPNFDADKATLTYNDGEDDVRSWSIVPYDDVEDATHGIYRFEPINTSTTVRMQFEKTDGTGNGTGEFVTEDDFTIDDHLDQDLIMEVYGEGVDAGYVALEYDGASYQIATDTGMLKVRTATEDAEYGDLEDGVVTGEPSLTAPQDTTYYINDKEVQVANTEGIALLFDDIVENNDVDGVSNTDLLEQRVDKELGTESTTRQYEPKYLDLVDRNNGNVWVAADQDVTVYWPLPEGTTKNTQFSLFHFEGMHREMGVDEVADDILNTPLVEDMSDEIQVTDTHIVFKISRAGFSPFVLTWDTKAPTPNPDPDPNPNPDPTPNPDPKPEDKPSDRPTRGDNHELGNTVQTIVREKTPDKETPTTPTTPIETQPDKHNPSTGDAGSVMLAMSAAGISLAAALMLVKKHR